MKRIVTLCAIVLASFATAFASGEFIVTADTCPEFPHAFKVQNVGNDTFTIEYIVVECTRQSETEVHMYVGSPRTVSHRVGHLGSIIRNRETVGPKGSRTIRMVFDERIAPEDITISVMVRDCCGNLHYICCNS